MEDPAHLVQIGRSHRRSVGEPQRRTAPQRGVAAYPVVVGLKLGQLPLQITPVPEQHLVQEFPAHRADQAFDERVRERHMRDRFEFVDVQNPQVRPPPVRVEQRIVIRTEMARCPRTAALNMRQTSAPVGAPLCTPNPTRRRVNWSMTTSTP